MAKAPEQILYDTSSLAKTKCLYYDHMKHLNTENDDYKFKAKILKVFANVMDSNKFNIVILD